MDKYGLAPVEPLPEVVAGVEIEYKDIC